MNLFRKLRNKLIAHKTKGNTTFVIVGFVCLWMAMFICYFLLTHNKIELIKASIEDEITSAILSGSLVDRRKYSQLNIIYIEDKETSLDNFEKIFGYTEGLAPYDTNLFVDGEIGGPQTHPYFDFDPDDETKKVKILEYIIYNVPTEPNADGDYIGEKFVFKDNQWSSEDLACNFGRDFGTDTEQSYIQTPLGENVTKTCVYIKMEMPLKVGFFNIKNTVTKEQTVLIELI